MYLLPKSEYVVSDASQLMFKKKVAYLVDELAGNQFKLIVSIVNEGRFRVSITGLPSTSKRIYKLKCDTDVFRRIYDTIYILLSNKEFFPSIGKSTGKLIIPTIEVPSWTALDAALANIEPAFFDEERMELHTLIYNLCIDFILRHEMRHIANGHIDYLIEAKKKGIIDVLSKALLPIDSQTIEMDVDSCVSVGFVEPLLNNERHRQTFPDKLRNNESILECYFFALMTLFYCLPSRKISSRDEAEASSHPNSTLRYFYAVTAGLSLLQDEQPELVEVFGRTHQRSWSFLDVVGRHKLIDANKLWADYHWSMSDEGMAHANRVWDNWNNWVPRLEPYAILKLAPPQDLNSDLGEGQGVS